MSEILEVCMVLCFGASWPVSIRKSYISRTAKGKSPLFLTLILTGYLCGIGNKFAAGNINYVLFFYILNAALVLTDILLYIRNRRIDLKMSQ